MDYKIIKYPRTQHLEGSRLGEGDEDLSQVPFSEILGRHIVIEEKIDGANSAISFDGDGNLLLQSRGHYLNGGYRERHYNLLKQWANENCDRFFDVLGCRYIMYGEWMYAKHTVFYDALPDYFMEFDIYDREREVFLSTPERRKMTDRIGIISSVPVIGEGISPTGASPNTLPDASTRSTAYRCARRSLTMPPFPIISLPTSNWGLIRMTAFPFGDRSSAIRGKM